ncbi:MAG: hypothetical protein ACTSQY_00935 [Candidatus Odinarchaeia archaeon]
MSWLGKLHKVVFDLGAITGFSAVSKKSIKNTLIAKGVTPAQLEDMYIQNQIVRGMVDVYRDLIGSSEISFVGTPKSVAWANAFRQTADLDFIYDQLLRDFLIFGRSAFELLYDNRTGKKLAGAEHLSVQTWDYIKEGSTYGAGRILLDEFNKPKGIYQRITTGGYANKVVTWNLDEIFLGIYNPIRNGLYGLGLVETSYYDALYLQRLKSDFADSSKRSLFTKFLVKVGDALHNPTKDQVETLIKQIGDVNGNSTIGVPYYVNVDMLENKYPEKQVEVLRFFLKNIMAGSGVSDPLVFGGEAINRSTLNIQIRIMIARATRMRQLLDREIQRQLLWPAADQWGVDRPFINRSPIELQDMNDFALRMKRYNDSNLFELLSEEQKKELLRIIFEMENLKGLII